MNELDTEILPEPLYDYLGQELKVGQRCFYMNSAKGNVGRKCTILGFNKNGIEIQASKFDGYDATTTVKIPERFIVLEEIYENRPDLLL